LIAAKYVGVSIETPDFNMGVDNKTPEFLAKNPLGKVPTMETPDGPIWESNAIARYVARLGKNNIYGKNSYEAGVIDQWIDFTTWEIDLPKAAWLYPIAGFLNNNPTATNKAKADIRKGLGILNDYLQTRTYLVGHRVSLADIIVVCSLYNLYTTVLDLGFRKPFSHTNRWFLTCVNQPEFRAVLGEVQLCQKMAVAPKAAAAEPAPKPEKPKKEQPPKKESKPAKEKEEDDDEEDIPEEEGGEPKKKEKNPLDLLPPSKFIMDEWKRTYSNQDTRTEAIPWLWEHFDKEGYSWWLGDYKYNDENQKLFMTANLIGGFIQRVEKLRKYGFGSIIIFGEEEAPPFTVSSVWLVRGLELPAEMKECDDYEHYNWKKADTDDAATRELINDFLAWDGKFGDGRKFNQGKIFK